MEARADRFSEVELLKRRAQRFEEEVSSLKYVQYFIEPCLRPRFTKVASELVQPKVAEKKNIRFRRFMEEEEDDGDEITIFSRMSLKES